MIPIRRMSFDWSQLRDRRWFGGDPFLTHLVEALSLTFPLGERFFVDAVKRFRGELALLDMDADIRAFIGQEAHHGRAHETFNAWLSEGVPDAASLEARVARTLEEGRAKMSPMQQLAVTCALEHFTAVMAELLLGNAVLREKIHPDVRRLLVWHAIEETEHKAVAFDVYQKMGGSYVMRAIVMIDVTITLFATTGALQAQLMRASGSSRKLGRALHTFGWLARIVPPYLAYYRPGFHPWDRNPLEALESARVELGIAA